ELGGGVGPRRRFGHAIAAAKSQVWGTVGVVAVDDELIVGKVPAEDEDFRALEQEVHDGKWISHQAACAEGRIGRAVHVQASQHGISFVAHDDLVVRLNEEYLLSRALEIP